MYLRIRTARPIKEMVIRFSVDLLEMQGNKEALVGSFDIAIDVQPHVIVDPADNEKVQINDAAIYQELANTVASLQYTAGVARELEGRFIRLMNEQDDGQELSD